MSTAAEIASRLTGIKVEKTQVNALAERFAKGITSAEIAENATASDLYVGRHGKKGDEFVVVSFRINGVPYDCAENTKFEEVA